MWAAFALIFVFVFYIIIFRSWILSLYCILLVCFSIILTQVLYIKEFQITYFSTIHNVIMFLLLGVSGNNSFVMFDAWKQSATVPEYEGIIRKRIAYAWKRAASTLLVTSSCTIVCFCCFSMT